MKNNFALVCALAVVILFASCSSEKKKETASENKQKDFTEFLQRYYDNRMELFPLDATANGDNRFNDILPVDISDAYREKEKKFFQDYLNELNTYDETKLNENDQMSFEILNWELNINIEGLQFPDNLTPINQFWSLPLTFGQLGSGKGNQPFNTVKDYENFLGRVNGFHAWCDTSIAYMRKGIAMNYTNPKVLM